MLRKKPRIVVKHSATAYSKPRDVGIWVECRQALMLSLFFLLTACLTACGFHLRGMMDMPRWLTHVAIINSQPSGSVLAPSLVQTLESYRLIVDDDPATAQYWIVIDQEHFQEHITSVSSSTTPRQYELNYTVSFKLTTAKGKALLDSTPVSVTRQATINSDRILGSTQEEELLKQEMIREATVQIINRISRESSRLNINPHVSATS